MAPNRMQLQNMSQKKDESFKEYAQRWREMASRVQPPLMEKELVDIFMSTLQVSYYDKMVGSISSGFSDLVVIGERIENGIKNGKIQGAPSGSYQAKKSYDGKKEPNTVGKSWLIRPRQYNRRITKSNRVANAPGGQSQNDHSPRCTCHCLKLCNTCSVRT